MVKITGYMSLFCAGLARV